MQAAFYTRQGLAAEVLQVGEQPTPQPGAGEVRVRLRTSGVNPSDWKVRKGGSGRTLGYPLVIPHSDGAGVIDAAGEGVPASRIGERVWTWNAQWNRAGGTAAQWIALPSAQAVTMPPDLDDAAGACLGIPLFTAVQAVRYAQLRTGMRVLVSGGAGAVSHYAIQAAKARCATVLTTVSGDAKADHARSAGADHVINYRTEDVGERVQAITEGRGVDAVIEMDISTNAALLPRVLRTHGTLVVYGVTKHEATMPVFWLMRNMITMRFIYVYELEAEDRAGTLDEINTLLRGDKLQHAVALRLPLKDIARAHELVEKGAVVGNVVLDIP